MTVKILPWKLAAIFSGVSIYELQPGGTGGLPYTTINFNDDINADHNCRRRQRTTMMINKDNVEMGKSWRW